MSESNSEAVDYLDHFFDIFVREAGMTGKRNAFFGVLFSMFKTQRIVRQPLTWLLFMCRNRIMDNGFDPMGF